MFRKFLLGLGLLGAATAVNAQGIDVQHYEFRLQLSDSSDRIYGETLLDIKIPEGDSSFALDLYGPRPNGKGMGVTEFNGYSVKSWRQEKDRIVVSLKGPAHGTDALHFLMKYDGIPADGLIISKNKYGQRTFFADNWPNRAHHWIPCNDRPDDKASFTFAVRVPAHYSVISNGRQDDPMHVALGGKPYINYIWTETTPQPTKVMVIGAARFAVKTFSDSPAGIPVTAWVFPQDSTKGFHDYGLAPSILKFFSSYIAPFPYRKLANVQSKTIFGGMENASCIFYAEESVTGDRKWEDVIAHEIAHQWFGDMATEKSFTHLWLSEGFATYLTNIYIENKYGVDSMRKRLRADREQVIAFAKANPNRAIVDSTKDLMSLLNANSYQKGGWVLHMLRQEVGDATFRQILQAYYTTYKGRNAETEDFLQVADSVNGVRLNKQGLESDLRWFFDQWLDRPGIPTLRISQDLRGNKVVIRIRQVNQETYNFDLDVALVDERGKTTVHKVPVSMSDTEVKLESGGKVARVVYDPAVKLLFDHTIVAAPKK